METFKDSYIIPKAAIILYEAGYSELGEFTECEDGILRMTSVTPMTDNEIAEFLESEQVRHKKKRRKSLNQKQKGFIEPCIQYLDMNERTVAWTRSAQFTDLYFKNSNLPDRLSVYLPRLLFIEMKCRSLYVFAIEEDFPINMDTKLFVAPLMNISEGSVCLGSTVQPKTGFSNVSQRVKELEMNFFLSRFSEFRSEEYLKGIIGSDIIEYYNSGKQIPDSHLVNTEKTLKDYL